MKLRILLLCLLAGASAKAQRFTRFEFNLYTDSLKKGFYNYISVDGQLPDGSWRPLDSTQVVLHSNTGTFRGNDLFIDSSYTGDSVQITAALRTDPSVKKQIVIYIRRRGFGLLPSEEEVLRQPADNKRKGKN